MWFAAKLVFESSLGNEGDRVLQEESIRLIQADGEIEARSKATQLGASEQLQFSNAQGETVAWHFVSLLEIQDLCEANVSYGMEIFSTMKRKTLPRRSALP